jgi:hypothetical protein
MEQQERERQAAELIGLAPSLRPAVQAVLEFAVAGARAVLRPGGGDPDEVWAATVVNIGQALNLDLEQQGQLTAAVAVTELVMQQAGYER